MPARAASSPRRPRWNPTFGNPSWDEASVRILVARLSPFSVAERSSTHLELCYEARRGAPRAYLDLVFYPEVGAEAEAGGPRSLHGSRRPRDFDLILLSNSYLLELLNVPRFLEESGIPLEARERRHGDPVLILGGANATAASALAEPVGGASGQAGGWAGAWASYVDAFFFGEGEAQVRLIAACFERARGEGRRRALAELEREVGAIWAPRLPGEEPGRAPRRAVAGPVGLEDIPTDYPVLDGEEAATARLQITWGCPALCSFCFESHDRRPYREVDREVLLEAARRLKRSTGAERLELLSFNFSYHSSFPSLLQELGRLFRSVSFMSQRIDVLARNPELLPFEIAAGKRSYTLGIEGVSERLRSFLQKGIGTEELEAVPAELARRRVRELKLFYILTGYEEEADLEELGAFLSRLSKARSSEGVPRLIVSATWLLRMPFTPLRHDPPLLDRARADRIARRLERLCAARSIEFRLASAWEEHVTCQLLASAGHEGRSLLGALSSAGARYDGEFPRHAWPVVERWMAAHEAVVARVVSGAPPRGGDAFSFVEGTPDGGRLEARYREALESLRGRRREPPLAFAREHACLDVRAMEELVRARGAAERQALACVVRTEPETAGAGPEWLGAWLMRGILRSSPAMVDVVFAVELLVPSAAGEWDFPWYGRSLARVAAWDPAAVEELARSGVHPFVAAAPQPGPGEQAELRELEARVAVPGGDVRALRAAVDDLVASLRCPVLTTRQGDGYAFAATASGRKRRSFLRGEVTSAAGGAEVRFVAGPRLPMRELVRALASAWPGAGEPVVEVTGLAL